MLSYLHDLLLQQAVLASGIVLPGAVQEPLLQLLPLLVELAPLVMVLRLLVVLLLSVELVSFQVVPPLQLLLVVDPVLKPVLVGFLL